MESVMFFVVLPATAFVLQGLLTRSKLGRRWKLLPLTVTLLVLTVCGGGVLGWFPLPRTYLLDKGSFLAFPDHFYLALFCLPVLFGLGLGALFGAAEWPKEGEG